MLYAMWLAILSASLTMYLIFVCLHGKYRFMIAASFLIAAFICHRIEQEYSQR